MTLPSASLNPQEPQKAATPNLNVNWTYTMPVTEQQQISLSPSIQSNPEQEPYRYASAMRFSQEYGLSMENAMVRLDELTQWQTGKAFTPEKTTWKSIVDSIEIGKIQPQLAKAQRDYKYAELAGQDTTAILAQIADYENVMNQLGDSTPRNLVTQAIKFGAETAPLSFQIAMTGAGKGAIAGLGAALVAGMAGVATVGALPVSVAASIVAVATAAGTAFSYQEAFKTIEGGEYYRLRKNGVPQEVALPVSNISSWVQAGLEVALGTVASKFGISTNTLTSKVLAKLAISGKWGAVGMGLMNLTGNALEEGAEEFAQSISGWVADITAAEIADIQAPERTMSVVKEAMLAAKGGFLAGVILAGGGTTLKTISDARTLGALKSDAQNIPSKEAYIEKYKAVKPEGVTDEQWASDLSKIHQENRPIAEEQAVKEIDTTSEATGPLNRLKSGRLYTQESVAVDVLPDGSESRSLLVGDPVTGDRYGYISYNIKGNTIEIDDVRFGTEYEASRKDAILELGRQNPNMDMVWNPETESLQDIRESIITDQGSLNPFTADTDVEARMNVEQQIAKAMPNLDAPQRIAASVLLEARAGAKGLSLQEYLDKQFSADIFGGDIQGKRGGIEFKRFEDGVKAVIYAGKNADFSTFAHETFHLFRREMTQTAQLQSALTQASQDAQFSQYVQDNQGVLNVSPEQAKSILASFGKDWTRSQEEFAAKLWELYLTEGKAPTSRLQAFFDKFAKWFKDIYDRLSGRTQLDPRIREVFDSLLDKDSPLAQEARKSQQQDMSEADTMYQDNPPKKRDVDFINDGGNPNILYQDEISTEAQQFSSWEDFRDGYSAFLEAMYGEIPDMDDEWYRNTWERANPQGNDMAMDERFVQSMNSEGLLPFLKEMGLIITERMEAPDDQDMANYNERMTNLKFRVQKVSPTILSNAIGSLKKTPSATEMKKIRTTISNASRIYRDLYADVMQKPEMKPIVLDELLPSIAEPEFEEVERISIADRVRLSQKIEATELKQKVLSGEELFDGEAEKVVRQMNIEIAEAKADITKLQAEYKESRLSLNESDRKVIDLQDQIDEARKALTKAQKNIQKRINRNLDIPKALTDERRTLSEQVKSLMAQFNELSKNNRTLAANVKRDAVAKATNKLKEKQKALNEARKVREYKTRLAAKIMAPVSKSIDYKYKSPIEAIQMLLDPNFRSGKVKYKGMTINLKDMERIIRENEDYDISSTLPKRIIDRIEKTPLNEWTVAELEDLAYRVATLRKTGRLELEARNEYQRGVIESEAQSVVNSVMSSKKFQSAPIKGTVKDVEEKYSAKNIRRIARYTALGMDRKAQLIDGYKKGAAYDLLINKQRIQDDIKQVNIDRRLDRILAIIKEKKISEKDLYGETFTVFSIPIVRNGKTVNENQDLTRDALADVYASTFRPEKQAAIAYGNFIGVQEKAFLSDEEIIALGDERFSQALEVAKTNLKPEHMMLIDAVFEDAKIEFPRANEVYQREFNMVSPQVENYSSIFRVDDAGNDIGKTLMQDISGGKAAGTERTKVEQGFLQETVSISPRNQTPIQLGLLQGHTKAVQTMEHFIAFAGLAKEMNRVFRGRSETSRLLRSTIISTYGEPMMNDVVDHINEVINQKGRERAQSYDKVVKFMRGNLYAAYLTWKTSTIVLQLITSPMPFLAEVNPIKLSSAYLDMSAHPLEVMNFIASVSPFMKHRIFDYTYATTIAEKLAKYNKLPMKALLKSQEVGALGIQIADKWSVSGGWLAVYRQEIAKIGDSVTPEGMKQAVRIADDVVRRTQPSGKSIDLAPMFKKGGEAMKAFTQFQTALNVIWQNTTFDLPMFVRQSLDKTMPKAYRQKQFARVIGTTVGYTLAGAILGAVMEGFDKDDDEADKAKKLLYFSLTQFTDSVPLLGSFVSSFAESAITGEKPYLFPTEFYPMASKLTKGVIDLTQGDLDKAMKNLSEGFGYATGLPVSGVKQAIRAFDEGAEALLGRIE